MLGHGSGSIGLGAKVPLQARCRCRCRRKVAVGRKLAAQALGLQLVVRALGVAASRATPVTLDRLAAPRAQGRDLIEDQAGRL